MNWFGRPVPINRMLGLCDQDDSTNLPVGLAAVCRNIDFTRDSGGPTCATVRAGKNTSLQCIDRNAPVTGLLGFVYEPESATDPAFQLPLAFQPTQGSQYEFPVGSGHMVKFPPSNFTEPQGAHAIQVSADNQVFSAYSDLKVPLSSLSTMDPKAKTLNPFGMKPFGWNWAPGTPILAGEVCTPSSPSTGNGHTYQAQNSGTTAALAANQPDWPLDEGDTVNDNGVIWKEHTMVIANRLPPPDVPPLFVVGGGAIAAGKDVYIVITLSNQVGETLPSVPEFISTIAGSSTVQVLIPALGDLAGWIQGLAAPYLPVSAAIYVAIVNHGAAAPPLSTFPQFVGGVDLGTTVDVTGQGLGVDPPSSCTARVTPGQLPIPTTAPQVDRNPSAGSFPAGRDVYVLFTYTNDQGETPAGPPDSVVNTSLNDGVQVLVTVPLGDNNVQLFEIGSVGVYEADVASGEPAPPASAFNLVGYHQPGDTVEINVSASGQNPPLTNTTGPGGAIVADTPAGGPNGTQGYRYAACMWINQIETISGFTEASVVKTIIDQDGWEIGVFNVPIGMPNIVGRIVAFTIADGTHAGPFNWIGLVNLQVPSQNVVYPTQTLVDAIEQSATVFLDNTTTQGTFNFSDTYIATANSVTDRLSIGIPPQGVRVDFLESVGRLVVTGVPGLLSGAWISLGLDPESFDAANSPVPIASAGDVCFGVTDQYKGIPIAIMKSGGFVLSPNTGNPNSWSANRRWGGNVAGKALGPCGFRAWAACGKFIIFAHVSGLYKYDESDPDMMSKEVPKMWSRINWAAGETISVTIDEDTHTVIVLVPTGASAVPNEQFILSYIEGWQNPIHFSTYSGKEISMDAARRWSSHDGPAFLCLRMERTLPPGGNAYIDGPSFETLPDSSFGVTQLLFASSADDGTVQARTPGVFTDNGGGIDAQYETMSSGMMQAVCKPEGFNLNAAGWGTMFPSFISSRDMVSDEGGETKLIQELEELVMEPVTLTPKQNIGITRKCPPSVNEFWRLRFTNGKIPNNWFSLKQVTSYIIPVTPGRDPGDR